MNRDQAIAKIADGHAIYKAEAGKEILAALGVPWNERYAYRVYDEPGVWKGREVSPENEGQWGVNSLTLGAAATSHLGLKVESMMGRGFQGRAYADALLKHFAKVIE